MMRRILGLAILAATAVGAAGALAQAPAPAGDYGGGAIVSPPTSVFDAGNVSISLHATSDGKVQILAYMGAKCRTAFVKAATRATDGSFSASGTATANDDGVSLRTKYEISGTVAATEASGTVTATTTVKAPGSAARTCDSGTSEWHARRASGAIGTPAGAQPGAQLFGTTSQRIGQRHHAIVLRVSSNNTRLRRVLYTVNLRCAHATIHDRRAIDRTIKIAANGKVSSSRKRTQKTISGVRFRTVERFSGKVGSEGAAGKLSVTTNFIDASGHPYSRCKSGTVKWKAAP